MQHSSIILFDFTFNIWFLEFFFNNSTSLLGTSLKMLILLTKFKTKKQ